MIDKPFLKSLNQRIQECSTIAQLDSLYNLFRRLDYSTELRSLFISRCKFLLNKAKNSGLQTDLTQCMSLLDELTSIPQITLKNETRGEIELLMMCNTKQGSIYNDTMATIISGLLKRTGGKKKEVARIMGLNEGELDALISSSTIIKKSVSLAKNELKKKLGFE